VADVLNIVEDDGNTNEHVYVNKAPRMGWSTVFDGSINGAYSTASGTLYDCYQRCENGTWAGCVGFSRYIATPDDTVGSCWWVTDTDNYVWNDGNNNENLYRHKCTPSAGLFISEVMEGTSYNKAVEFYNPTLATISLDDYTIGRVSVASHQMPSYA
jgi:hypothetical protein